MEVRAPPHYYYDYYYSYYYYYYYYDSYHHHHHHHHYYYHHHHHLIRTTTTTTTNNNNNSNNNKIIRKHCFVRIKVTLIYIADEFRNCANHGKLGPIVMFLSVNMNMFAFPITENFMIS
jgi:hypothetical protein